MYVCGWVNVCSSTSACSSLLLATETDMDGLVVDFDNTWTNQVTHSKPFS